VNFRIRPTVRVGWLAAGHFDAKFLVNFADEVDCTHRREFAGRSVLIRWGEPVGWVISEDFPRMRGDFRDPANFAAAKGEVSDGSRRSTHNR
jgi:hypothetical protein